MGDVSIGFLGGGRMASALMRGLLREREPGSIGVYDPVLRPGEPWLGTACRVFASPAELFAASRWLVWAIKPQVFHAEAAAWRALRFSGTGWISIMAGVRLARLEALAGNVPVVRAMPNLPLMLGAGAVALAPGRHAGGPHLEEARRLFAPVGEVLVVDEKAMDGVTALSGSGPAYLFYLAEVVDREAHGLGLTPEAARKLWAQTLLGSARMLAAPGAEPAELRRQVTSPGGTTQAALEELERRGFAAAFAAGLAAARDRSVVLSGS